MLRSLYLCVLALLPSKIKIWVLRFKGAKIGRSCRIGLTIIDSENIDIGDYVYIGNFNIIWRLNNLKLETGSKLGDGNWITGGGGGSFSLGRNSSLRRFHYLDASGSIKIGMNSILAGRGIQMITHGLHPETFQYMRPIVIDDWCYIGAFTKFVPGSSICKGTFVGMGAVVTKSHHEEYILLGGNPARKIRSLDVNSRYFQASYLPHNHHPSDYLG